MPIFPSLSMSSTKYIGTIATDEPLDWVARKAITFISLLLRSLGFWGRYYFPQYFSNLRVFQSTVSNKAYPSGHLSTYSVILHNKNIPLFPRNLGEVMNGVVPAPLRLATLSL